MKPAAMFAAAFGLALALGPTLALADGGGGGGSGGANADCPRGEIWDQRSGRCVKQGSALPDKVLRDYAYALAKAERYDEALATLDLLRNPNTPEALNYRGYATRKLGRLDEGIGYYLKSVALAPRVNTGTRQTSRLRCLRCTAVRYTTTSIGSALSVIET